MIVINVTDKDNITDYDNMPLCNCTNDEYDINLTIPLLIFTFPCSLSFLFLISIVVYTLIKPKKKHFN